MIYILVCVCAVVVFVYALVILYALARIGQLTDDMVDRLIEYNKQLEKEDNELSKMQHEDEEEW